MKRRFHKCSCCGRFMRLVHEEWSPTGTLLHFECACGGYEVSVK